ncbi:MAG: thiamine-phosphate kinase [Candidatus Nanohalarchaeota archaeon]|nr:MAG: thiamine-phosphate kinase [Candidatus Nanohaloarchaeota archaeon]
MTKISQIGGEQALIKRIQKAIKTSKDEVILGIGDDAAIIKPPKNKNKNIAITTDMLVENNHFSLSTHTAEQIGKKSAVANISDMAAIAATPKHMLISLAIPKDTTVEFIDRLYKGITKETGKHNINIIGGDITGSPSGALTINIVILGETSKEIRRSGAKPGDCLMVTGDLGKSAAGLHTLQHNPKTSKKTAEILKKAHLEPSHRLKESQTLKKLNCITSMNDISDGLATETKEICEASKVGAIIYKQKIPTTHATDELLKAIKKDTKETALYGGEDFELLFTAKKQDTKKIIDTLKKHTGTTATIIGKITKEKQIYLIDKTKKTRLKKTGYDHFKENPFDYKK